MGQPFSYIYIYICRIYVGGRKGEKDDYFIQHIDLDLYSRLGHFNGNKKNFMFMDVSEKLN